MILKTISIISMLFFGGIQEDRFLDELEKGVKVTVQEAERKETILEEIKNSKLEIKNFNDQRKDELKLLKKINADPNSTEVEFKAFYSNLIVERVAFQSKIAEDRITLDGMLSQDEWDMIFPDSGSEPEDFLDQEADSKVNSKFQSFVQTVDNTILDTSRNSRIKASIDSLEMQFESIKAKILMMHKHQSSKIYKKELSKEEIMAINSEANSLSTEAFEMLKDFHFALKAEVNEDEWKKLIKEFNNLIE